MPYEIKNENKLKLMTQNQQQKPDIEKDLFLNILVIMIAVYDKYDIRFVMLLTWVTSRLAFCG